MGAVGNRADLGAGRRFALIEDRSQRAEESIDAIFVGERLSEIATQHAARMLRRDVAQQLYRKARVVLDDPVDFLDGLALRPQLDRAQLQTLHKDIAGAGPDAPD